MEEEIILEIFSKRLQSLIEENHTDILVLAQKLGLKSKSTIYRYMNAEMTPKITAVKYIAELYNVNPVWLMGYDVPKKTPKNNLKDVRMASNNGVDLDGLSEEDIKQVNDFVEFIRNKKKD